MRTLLLLLLFSLSHYAQAQDRLADSLHVELSKASTDSARIVLNCSLSKHYSLTDAIKARQFAEAAVALANASGNQPGKTKALLLFGNAQLMMGDYDKAMSGYFEALKISRQLNDTASTISSLLNLGNVYNKIGDEGRAVSYYQKASELAHIAKDTLRYAASLNNLGDSYEGRGIYAKALKYYRQAAELYRKIDNKKGLAIALHNIGNLHLYIGRPADGLPYLFESVRLNEMVGNNMIRMSSLGRIAELYLVMGKHGLALQYASEGYKMAMQTGSSKKIAEAARNMHTAYAAMQDYGQAYDFLLLYNKHNDLINAESKGIIETELTVRYETEQKELENSYLKEEQERQQAEIRLQRYLLAAGGLILVLLLGLLVELYNSRRRQGIAYGKLQKAHQRMHAQHTEIIEKKDEIVAQALLLREQNERLEKHHAFKNKIFSIISHDLRGPFVSIKGVLGLAKHKNMTEQEVKHIFGLLSKNTEVATNMLDNVLIWAKAQLEELSVTLQPVDLHELVGESLALVEAHAIRKDIRLVNNTTEQTLVAADRERLHFVLRNLMMNAIKFSHSGGEVRVKAEVQQDNVMLSVSDDGKGISAENLAKLFSNNRFTTLGTSGEKGTGLGLMLCKELLESFNGSISVNSKLGGGSTFTVLLQKALPCKATKKVLV